MDADKAGLGAEDGLFAKKIVCLQIQRAPQEGVVDVYGEIMLNSFPNPLRAYDTLRIGQISWKMQLGSLKEGLAPRIIRMSRRECPSWSFVSDLMQSPFQSRRRWQAVLKMW